MNLKFNWEPVVKFIVFLLMLFLLIGVFSCTPKTRLARLTKKHPELFKSDTTWIKDTVITEAVKVDTVFSDKTDSVVIREKNMIIKYYHTRDSVFLYGECKGDTIIREVPVIHREVRVNREIPWQLYLILGIMVVLFVLQTIRK